jgi:2-oxoisovalerate dehydrogenase E1 component alpha subunit
MKRVLNLDGSINGDLEPQLSDEELLKWMELMVTLRNLDERGMNLQRQGRIGFHIPTRGQEAHIAVAAAIEDRDWIFPAYREHGCALYRGYPLEKIVNHLFANEKDPQKGRRLPGLFGDRDIRFVNPSAPVGTQIIHAVGAGYAAKYAGDDVITVVFFGDGATSSNDFHSGMNFAGVFKTPTILICQNNGWAISMPSKEQTAAEDIVDKAEGYGMPGIQVDGNDPLALYTVVKDSAERARNGEGPTFIESLTYRMGPHTSSDDPSRYRDELGESEEWRRKDPIDRFKNYLIDKKIITESDFQDLEDKVNDKLRDLINEASEVPKPGIESIFTDVYSEMPWHLEEQLDELRRLKGGRG